MRVAITGTTGRVGKAMAAWFSRDHEVIRLPRHHYDLDDSASLARVLDALDCDAFVNPAGLTSLEACEDDPPLAGRLNAEAPAQIAAWAADRGVKFVHFSTDYVFSGNEPGPRVEEAVTFPLSEYGRSKRRGELAVLEACPEALILRVSWVFGPEKPSFVDQVIDAALAGKPLAAIGDKFSLPTHTADLAAWTEALLASSAAGIVHACNPGDPASWHCLASATVEELFSSGALPEKPDVAFQKLDEIPAFRAPRPRHTAMCVDKLRGYLGGEPRPWQEALAAHVRDSLTRRGTPPAR